MSAGASAKMLLRRVPGVVAAKRMLVRAFRVARPLRPPVESPDLVARMRVPPPDDRIITGNGFAGRCRFVVNYDVLDVNEDAENADWWFCNPEFLEYFFRDVAPDREYVLFTHNSNVDRPVDASFVRRLARPELVAWFATNVELRHPKLHSIPLGVGNPIKCDPAAFRAVQDRPPAKSELFEASFDVSTNPVERAYCIEQTGIRPAPKTRSQTEFYERLAGAYFCISPSGNGVDCYRTWQALYLGTIPVVTRSILTEQHAGIPWIVLDDWADFRTIDFSEELYERTWGDWDPAALTLDRYLERVTAIVGGTPALGGR